MIIVSNASPIITISRIKLFHHLPALYESLTIPNAVFEEVVKHGAGRPGSMELSAGIKSGFINIKPVKNNLAVSALSEFFGRGEAEAIILASEISAKALIMDDHKARITSNSMNLHVTGTIGILLELKDAGLIPGIKPFIDKAVEYGFRINPSLYNKILQKAAE